MVFIPIRVTKHNYEQYLHTGLVSPVLCRGWWASRGTPAWVWGPPEGRGAQARAQARTGGRRRRRWRRHQAGWSGAPTAWCQWGCASSTRPPCPQSSSIPVADLGPSGRTGRSTRLAKVRNDEVRRAALTHRPSACGGD